MWIIIVVLVVLWLLGFLGPRLSSASQRLATLSHVDRHRCHTPHFASPRGAVNLSGSDDRPQSVAAEGVFVVLERQGICHPID